MLDSVPRAHTSVAILTSIAVTAFGLMTAREALAANASTQGKNIAFVSGVAGSAFYASMACGIRSEAKKYGFNVTSQGPQQWDPSLQTPIVNAVVVAKPAGILIAPDNSKAMYFPISQATKAGIKVGLVDTTLDDTSSAITSIATDNTAGGAAAADALAELIDDKGKVMLIAFQAGASTSDQRQKGFEQEIKKFPNIKYLGYQISNSNPSNAATEVSATLAAHPDLAGIFANNDLSAEGAATGLRNANRAGSVKLVAFDADEAEVKLFKEGLVQALVAQQPYRIGVLGVDAVANSLMGKGVTRVVTTDTITVDEANFSQPDVQNALYRSKCD